MMSLHVLIVYIFLSTSFLMTCNAVEDTTINRAPRDIFRIPSTMCQNDIETQCNSMGATQRTYTNNKRNGTQIKVNCTCQCKFNTTYNVFGRFNNQWKCERNSDVRHYNFTGCSLIRFNNKNVYTTLRTVTPKKDDQKTIIGKIMDYHYCEADHFFSYLDCESSWVTIDGVPFSFDTGNSLLIYNRTVLGMHPNSSKIYGHIIKLGVNCTNVTGTDAINYTSFCVVFKVRGQQKCSVIYPTTSTPTTAAEPFTLSKAQTTTSSSTRARTTTEKQTTTDKPQKQNRESTDSDDDSGIIAGGIGGVAVLVAVLVILVVIWFKRKRNSPNERTAANETVENHAYDGVDVCDNNSERPGQQTSADDEYSYAYTNTHPVVIRDQNGTALQGPHLSNGHVGNIKASTGSPSSSEFPIYNILDDPDYAKREKSDVGIGPSYDILEGSEDKPAMAQGSPFYDVLENPNSTGTPVYDVLEEPESDEQHVYGSLQNNDPPIYGALQSPTSHSGEANSEYDDDYNLADVDRNVYQELNQERQRSSDDVYEPLRHSRVLIDMKDIN